MKQAISRVASPRAARLVNFEDMTICTVAIPVYNRAKLAREAIESALAQDLLDYEVLGVDNCSTDGTWETLESFDDPRFRCLRNYKNLGLFGNMNRGVELAQGKYLRILCSDDRLLADCRRAEIDLMERHPNISLLSSRGIAVSETGSNLGKIAQFFPAGIHDGATARIAWFSFFANYGYNPPNYPSGVLFRRSALIEAMAFDESLGAIADIDVFLRTLEHGDLAITDQLGCMVMQHEGQEGSDIYFSGRHIDESRNLVERYRLVLSLGRVYRQTKRRMAALPLGWALKRWRRMGRRTLRKITDYGDSWGTVFRMTVRFAIPRHLLKTPGFRLTPHLHRVSTLPRK